MREGFARAGARDRAARAGRVADGFIRIAVENMANAIKRISVAQGLRLPRLCAELFRRRRRAARLPGGRCARHDAHVHPSVFGRAVGLWHEAREPARCGRRGRHARSSEDWSARSSEWPDELGREAASRYRWRRAARVGDEARRCISATTAATRRCRSRWTASTTWCAHSPRRMRGCSDSVSRAEPLIVESLEAEAVSNSLSPLGGRGAVAAAASVVDSTHDQAQAPSPSPLPAEGKREVGSFRKARGMTPVADVDVSDLATGATARMALRLLIEPHQTIVVEPGWAREMTPRARDCSDARADMGARRAARRRGQRRSRCCSKSSPICSWRSPRRWAPRCRTRRHRVNIKERLDFSCAIFDADGGLVANAPHMPVHLGSMGDCVTAIMAQASAHARRRRFRHQRAL